MMVVNETESRESSLDTRVMWITAVDSDEATDQLIRIFAKGRELSKEDYLGYLQTYGELKGCSVGQ